MPIEVTPSLSHYMPMPMSMRLPLPLAGSAHPGWASSVPLRQPTGPARAVDILPSAPAPLPGSAPAPTAGSQPRHMPGSILPNGLRNPWAPYAGETYMPSSVNALNSLNPTAAAGAGPGAGSLSYVAGGGGIAGSVVFPGESSGGGSFIAPSAMSFTSSRTGYSGGLGGDDGWNGSLSRSHNAHAPDLSSTVTAIGPAVAQTQTQILGANGSAAGWAPVPSSWGNHRRMTPTPTVAAGLAATDILPQGSAYSQPMPMPLSISGRPHHSYQHIQPHQQIERRRSSHGPRAEECHACRIRAHSHSQSQSHGSGSIHRRRLSRSHGCAGCENC